MTAPRPEDVSIVVPTRGRWDILARTLAGLRAQTCGGFEVVVVVDGLDQRPPDLPDVRVEQVARGGPGAARNHGAAVTDRPLVLFLGDDMVPTRGLVAGHLDLHGRHPATTTAVLGHVDWHPDVARNRILSWLDWSSTQFDYVRLEGRGGEDVGFGRFYSCNVSLHRALFERVGGFDRDFVFYYEDLDLGYRLGEAGMVLRYQPEARAHHLHDYDLAAVERRFTGIAVGERLMADIHPWFTPWFHRRIELATARPRAHPAWPRVVDAVPRSLPALRRRVEKRADTWYLQHVAAGFLRSWQRARHLVELRRYLGEDFDPARLIGHEAEVAAEAAAAPDEATFYRTSRAYLYDLTAFAMSGTKDAYLDEVRRHLPTDGRVLDLGCGIGADGLDLLDEGHDVHFADFDNPSTAYLRWRLVQRGVDPDPIVHDVEGEVPGGFHVAFAFDVVEHVADPWALLATLEQRADVVVVNLLEDDDHDHGHQDLHHPLPIDAILAHARDRGLLHHEVHHARSHLVAYRGRP